ncbi:uncharacterized protein [Amphiura filiformis]|uniref:uncharacterized protein n=1 Tax=Amphiura filiformis TaxID=82378 RepID=UPI003B20E929
MMGLLQILAIVGLACLGSGYAQDVYVVCGLKVRTSTEANKVFTAPANTLAFTEVFSYNKYWNIHSISVDDSRSSIYFEDFYGKSAMRYDAQGNKVQVTPTGTEYVDYMIVDETGSTLYYFDYDGVAFSVDLTAADPSTTMKQLATTGRVISAAINGRDLYLTIFQQTAHSSTRDIRKLNVDTGK